MYAREKEYRLDLETINITDLKCLTLLPVTWLQLDGMIWISKTIDFATLADCMKTTMV